MKDKTLILVRGAGDLATGCIVKLINSGYAVAALESSCPTAIRRTVALSDAVFEGRALVEGVEAVLVKTEEEVQAALAQGMVPIICDEKGEWIEKLAPAAVVDAIIAKVNLGTTIDMAPAVIGLGPGFTAGTDCHAVIETNRGHDLARVIYEGSAQPNTGVPGNIGGFSKERVIRSPKDGIIRNRRDIAAVVEAGEVLAEVEGTPVIASISGVLRGIIRDGSRVTCGMKIGDIDPRAKVEACFTVSDKARSIAGGVLEALLHLGVRP